MVYNLGQDSMYKFVYHIIKILEKIKYTKHIYQNTYNE